MQSLGALDQNGFPPLFFFYLNAYWSVSTSLAWHSNPMCQCRKRLSPYVSKRVCVNKIRSINCADSDWHSIKHAKVTIVCALRDLIPLPSPRSALVLTHMLFRLDEWRTWHDSFAWNCLLHLARRLQICTFTMHVTKRQTLSPLDMWYNDVGCASVCSKTDAAVGRTCSRQFIQLAQKRQA